MGWVHHGRDFLRALCCFTSCRTQCTIGIIQVCHVYTFLQSCIMDYLLQGSMVGHRSRSLMMTTTRSGGHPLLRMPVAISHFRRVL